MFSKVLFMSSGCPVPIHFPINHNVAQILELEFSRLVNCSRTPIIRLSWDPEKASQNAGVVKSGQQQFSL